MKDYIVRATGGQIHRSAHLQRRQRNLVEDGERAA